MKALKWSQHYSLIFRRSRAANSEVSEWNLAEIQTHPSFIVDLVTCKNEEDPLKKIEKSISNAY